MSVSRVELTSTTQPAPAPAAPPGPAKRSKVLITTQQVLFGTAAALGMRRESTKVAATKGSRPRPHYEPKHYAFLENALMAREMGRL
jgi:hypothetical protein